MSREIDLTKRLNEDELRYLVDRDMWEALRENARNLGMDEPNLPSPRGIRQQVPRTQLRYTDEFAVIAKSMGVPLSDDEGSDAATPASAPGAEGSPSPPTGPQPMDYTKLTVPQLKEEMDKRRTQYEKDGDAEGVQLMTYGSDARKDDLISALQLDDDTEEEPES